MAEDKHGNPLGIGDRVALRGKIQLIEPGDDCRLTVVVENAAAEEQPVKVSRRAVVLIEDAAGVPARLPEGEDRPTMAASAPQGSPSSLFQGLAVMAGMPGNANAANLVEQIMGVSNTWQTVMEVIAIFKQYQGDIQKIIEMLRTLWNKLKPTPESSR